MKKLLYIILILAAIIPSVAADKKDSDQSETFALYGRIKESLGKTDLLNSFVICYDAEGNPSDTIRPIGKTFRGGEIIDISAFVLNVPKTDSTYVFDVACEGYDTRTISYHLDNPGKRESSRQMPVIYLDRSPRKLGEVTVTASKIKFYNKGDTIVFNADAFQLAEGSMLDALIAQLPGVELNEEGQIKVNGEFVESLLLNGKQFLDGNNKLMLENIGAYTVQNVEVYKGQTRMEKWENDPLKEKHLTMNVKLKKEYNIGWLINAQGGGGTEGRYTGRLFASWFNPTTNVTLLANVNNLNDTREPGKNDTWKPEMMPSGTRKYRMGAINYSYTHPEEKSQFEGYTSVEQTATDNLQTTARTNFLQGGDTYENAHSHSRRKDTYVRTQHYGSISPERFYVDYYVKGRYVNKESDATSMSATFDKEQPMLAMQAIEALYSDPTPGRLESVINRSITRTDGSSHDLEGQFFPNVGFKIPHTDDFIMMGLGVKYRSQKEDRWKDYTINFGADPTPAQRRRQYFDNSPNRTLTLTGKLTYRTRIKSFFVGMSYEYLFEDQTKDSYMYALDRLADMGVYGVLPAGYLDTFDPANSYTSRQIDNTHSLKPFVQYYKRSEKDWFLVTLRPTLAFQHSRLDYSRMGQRSLVNPDFYLMTIQRDWDATLKYDFKAKETDRGSYYMHSLQYSYKIKPRTPELIDMVDVVNDADPLNISLGNPDLKAEYKQSHTLTYTYTPSNRLSTTAIAEYSITNNALTRGYTYDTSTGVRRNRTYNVSGNSYWTVSDELRYQFGSSNQFTLGNNVSVNFSRYADMIGVDLQTPEPSKVNNRIFNEKLSFAWQIGKQELSLRGDYTNRHTTSSQTGFRTIDANHFSCGVTGRFKLPAGLGISTDFTLYTRRGYGVKELDTTDPIWNMRLTWSPRRAQQWVFMLDGFDMLHQLSNVNYAVTASGRTVSYTNALPRYVLLSVQYRLHIQPKKR